METAPRLPEAAAAAPAWLPRLGAWLGEVVVVDSFHPFVVLGTLTAVAADCLLLADADLHDLRDTETTRELYVVKAARHGIQPNRGELLVRLDQVLAVAPLASVEAG
jgi:hypothetical protein